MFKSGGEKGNVVDPLEEGRVKKPQMHDGGGFRSPNTSFCTIFPLFSTNS